MKTPTLIELIEKAKKDADADACNYGVYREGRFECYVVPVGARTRFQRNHYRSTFYLDRKRVSRKVMIEALEVNRK